MELSPEWHGNRAKPSSSRTPAPDHCVRSSTTNDPANELMDAQYSCTICDDLISCFYEHEANGRSVALGTAERILDGQCAHVELLKQVIPQVSEVGSTFDVQYSSLFQDIYINQYRPYRLSSRLGLVHQEKRPNHPGTRRIVDTTWIDDTLVRGWIKSCETTHPQSCKRLPFFRDEDVILPRYLIDTYGSCLVHGEESKAGYAALSYQWGQVSALQNVTKICQQLLEPGSLSLPDFASKLPQTVSDAIAVARLLGIGYLWVDAPCIVQDDHDQLVAELSQMHRIYSCASFTIVAAEGADASYGLRGFRGITAPREHWQTHTKLANLETLASGDPDMQPPSTYYTRAWTFQERHMSTRKLIFEKGGVEWQCGHGVQYEHLQSAIDHLHHVDGPHRWMKGMPTLQSFNSLLCYNTLELSFPEDAFAAFVGIQGMLHQSYLNGLVYGMPEFWFDIALNWSLDVYSSEPLTRRNASKVPRAVATPYRLPSWSWIGWAGPVQFSPDMELMHFYHGYMGFTKPVTKWYTMATPSSLDRRPINSEWYNYKLAAMDEQDKVPDGWKRVDRSRLPHPNISSRNVQIQPKYRYQHVGAPDEFYSYPFPVPARPLSAKTSTPLPQTAQTAYIFAKTSRAFMHGRMMYVENVGFEKRIWLTTSTGHHCGYLRLHNADEMHSFDMMETKKSFVISMELVATCQGYTSDVFAIGTDLDHELNMQGLCNIRRLEEDTLNANGPTDCYFVLWIEWVDGVAYRKASGTVFAEAWEQEKEEELVDLILG